MAPFYPLVAGGEGTFQYARCGSLEDGDYFPVGAGRSEGKEAMIFAARNIVAFLNSNIHNIAIPGDGLRTGITQPKGILCRGDRGANDLPTY